MPHRSAVVAAVLCAAALFSTAPADAQGFHRAAPVEPPPAPQAILAEPDTAIRLDPLYDSYLAWKERLQTGYGLEYYVQASLLPQWGAPKGGPAVFDFIWTPTIIWKPFTDTLIGSGSFTFSAQQNQFWTRANTSSQQARAGLLTPPSDWFTDAIDYAQLTYTHTLPGAWHWLSATVGQYSFGTWDANQYAGNAQTNFVNYALAQNGTQNYVSGDLGAYAEASAPARDLVFAGGFQGATNFAGSTITTRSFAERKFAFFLAARWSPNLLAGSSYGLLWDAQPAIPRSGVASSRGLSFNAVQNLSAQWGLFLRANTATGTSTEIAISLAWGAVRNDPFRHDPLDQVGLGIAWNKINHAAVAAPARNAEWVAEAYYNYTVFKGLQIAPDLQFYFDRALGTTAGPEAILTLRATATF
ncbi:MAG TPA: carbohydrate porin [Stellaceae bacterium]|nr:carbohydrate porin [Stellaceae bacterium]